ncbi:hypothetical protein CDD82_7392 [Ophiocordyceps australis]|uniref:Uncharacterized protein n=1 Tax=Ophiocordyceps australis TaxID=1399860 RepID=A0A2C5YQJ8_9HYPO|nr:hypothetical protein CDD82_7392 [Ophiocordyceps australis]
MFFAAVTLALLHVPGVLAGNPCINHQRHRCQWSNCASSSPPSPLYPHVEASTQGTSWSGICRQGVGKYPGNDCCQMYGPACWFSNRKLWCESDTSQPIAEYNGPRARQRWIESKGLWRRACADVGGVVWESSAAAIFHVEATELCICNKGQRWFDGRCIATTLEGL